jgi:hypothetical protein
VRLNPEQSIGTLLYKVFRYLILDSETNDAYENNAKYAISIARKLGASIFLVWEDIKDVKSKMLITFVASLYDVYLLNQKLKTEKVKILSAEGKTANLDN